MFLIVRKSNAGKGKEMISFEMEDLIGVLQGLMPYLVTIGLIIVAAIIISIAVKGQDKAKKSFTRKATWLAALAAVAVVVNLICFGPMSTLISLVSGGGQVSQETTDEASAVALNIAEEGFVLLENEDSMLPLAEGTKLNLFGWASTNPIYGGAGSGGINALFPVVSLIDGLKSAGFEVNRDLVYESSFSSSFASAMPRAVPPSRSRPRTGTFPSRPLRTTPMSSSPVRATPPEPPSSSSPVSRARATPISRRI